MDILPVARQLVLFGPLAHL